MDEDLVINDSVTIGKSELWFTASRSGGPGGQHVNKVSSRVTLHWDVSKTRDLSDPERACVMAALESRISNEGLLLVHVDENRSQHANKEIALKRLARLVKEALEVPKKRKPTRTSIRQKERRLDDKKHRSELKKKRRPPSDE